MLNRIDQTKMFKCNSPKDLIAGLFNRPMLIESTRLTEFLCLIPPGPVAGDQNKAAASAETDTETPFTMMGSTAVIPIQGILMKSAIPWLRRYGVVHTGYDEIHNAVLKAAADPGVEAIHLPTDSPGGMVAGLEYAVRAIQSAKAAKPVTAEIEDIGVSAAYWLTSQAGSITAGLNTEVGSIGVFSVITDASEMFESAGVKVEVVRSGPFKGQGVLGARVSEDYLGVEQQIVDQMADNFVKSVAAGRNMSVAAVRKLATGRAWLGQEAKELGLVDQVRSLGQQRKPSGQKQKSQTDADRSAEDQNTEPQVISPERQRDIDKGYRKAGRILNRLQQANA
jgi:signal peptide peptidase SppA